MELLKYTQQDQNIKNQYKSNKVIEEIKKNVSKQLDTQEKIDEYKNPTIRKHLEEFKEQFPNFRKIRGDGNCFYRAVGYLFLEMLIISQKFDIIISIIRELSQGELDQQIKDMVEVPYEFVELQKDLNNKFKPIFFSGLRYLCSISKDEDFGEKMYNQQNEFFEFDFCLVVYVRAKGVKQFDGDEMLQFVYDSEQKKLEDRKTFFIYGEEAKDNNLSMVYKALRVNVITNQVDKERFTPMNSGTENPILEINLFFRPGHYDACYSKDYIEQEMNQQLIYTQPDKQFLDQFIQKQELEEIKKNVSKKLETQEKIDEYKNPEIRKYLMEFQEKFPYFRKIRGDGNCFYRAISYKYFEYIIQNQNFDLILQRIQEIQQGQLDKYLKDMFDIPNEFVELKNNPNLLNKIFITGLKYLCSVSRDQDFQQKMYYFQNQCFQFDFAMILYNRAIAVRQFDQDDMIQYVFDTEQQKLLERRTFFQYGEEAQNSNLSMSYKAYKVNVITNQVDKQRFTQIDAGTENPIFEINLFFRPGHYDACYERENQKNQVVQNQQQLHNIQQTQQNYQQQQQLQQQQQQHQQQQNHQNQIQQQQKQPPQQQLQNQQFAQQQQNINQQQYLQILKEKDNQVLIVQKNNQQLHKQQQDAQLQIQYFEDVVKQKNKQNDEKDYKINQLTDQIDQKNKQLEQQDLIIQQFKNNQQNNYINQEQQTSNLNLQSQINKQQQQNQQHDIIIQIDPEFNISKQIPIKQQQNPQNNKNNINGQSFNVQSSENQQIPIQDQNFSLKDQNINNNEQKHQQDQKTIKILSSIIGVLLIFGIVFFILYLSKGNSDNSNQQAIQSKIEANKKYYIYHQFHEEKQ